MITIKNIAQNSYSLKIENKFSQEDAQAFLNLLEEIPEETTIKLMATFKDFPSFKSFKAFTETAKLKSKAIGKISKYAIVTDSDFVKFIAPIGDFFTPGMPVKQFDMDDATEAVEWLQKD